MERSLKPGLAHGLIPTFALSNRLNRFELGVHSLASEKYREFGNKATGEHQSLSLCHFLPPERHPGLPYTSWDLETLTLVYFKDWPTFCDSRGKGSAGAGCLGSGRDQGGGAPSARAPGKVMPRSQRRSELWEKHEGPSQPVGSVTHAWAGPSEHSPHRNELREGLSEKPLYTGTWSNKRPFHKGLVWIE